ncbi:hypothetical protein DFH06DRAFT_1131096 [Mycena polygramma]|nr:hypothetical protein DFH06DRAFT_1131096 [Mycena polygramma]
MYLQYRRDKWMRRSQISDPSPTNCPHRRVTTGRVPRAFSGFSFCRPKEVITVKFNKDTTNVLSALLHPVNVTPKGTTEPAVRGLGGTDLAELDKRALNPFATLLPAMLPPQGIISGLVLTAAGLWAPVPGRRSLGFPYENASIAITVHDPTSDHPVHRFISNYYGVLDRNPAYAQGAHVGFLHYAKTAASRHRLVVQPSGTGIPNWAPPGQRREFGSDVTVATATLRTTIPSQAVLLVTFRSKTLLSPPIYQTTKRIASVILSALVRMTVGQIQTQAGTDPSYDTDCEFSDQMVECTTTGD